MQKPPTTDARDLLAARLGLADPGSLNQETISDSDRYEACGATCMAGAAVGFGMTGITPESNEVALRAQFGEGGVSGGVAVEALEWLADRLEMEHWRVAPADFGSTLLRGDSYIIALTTCAYDRSHDYLYPVPGGQYGHYILTYDDDPSADMYGCDNPWGGIDERYAGPVYRASASLGVALRPLWTDTDKELLMGVYASPDDFRAEKARDLYWTRLYRGLDSPQVQQSWMAYAAAHGMDALEAAIQDSSEAQTKLAQVTAHFFGSTPPAQSAAIPPVEDEVLGAHARNCHDCRIALARLR